MSTAVPTERLTILFAVKLVEVIISLEQAKLLQSLAESKLLSFHKQQVWCASLRRAVRSGQCAVSCVLLYCLVCHVSPVQLTSDSFRAPE